MAVMELDYCFHSHTYRCGHAEGTDEEYVIEAIKAGVKVLGFSDHVILPDLVQPGTRGNYEELPGYIKSVLSLKERYKDKIQILLGFECEFFEQYENYYKSLKEQGFDYFLLGQHYLVENGKLVYLKRIEDPNGPERYFKHIRQGVETGLFLYIAHPDLYVTMFTEWNDYAEELGRRICVYAKEHNIPLEINCNGMTWEKQAKLNYPDERFWKIAGEIGNEVTIGYDAHYPEFYREQQFPQRAFDIIKKYNLKFISKEHLLSRIKK